MDGGELSYAVRGPLAVITLERPEALNALTNVMIAGIERLARKAEADPHVFAICITGAGRGFSAGLDMGVLAQHSSDAAQGGGATTRRTDYKPMFGALPEINKPVIAAVNGVAAGGGFILAMMCDMRFFGRSGSLVSVFARRGLIAEHGASWILPRLIGLNRALDMLWSSRRIDAEEAYRLGIADRLVDDDKLLDEVEAYVAAMAASVAPRAVATIKRQLYDHASMTYADAMRETGAYIDASLAHPDAKEGVDHFVEKRAPKFSPWSP